MRRWSLRARLALIILLPLLLISLIAGYWRYSVARQTAEELFDRTLLMSAVAISRDVAVSEGDAISPATTQLMRETSGGRIFYHVNAPDGVYVTGYATPPVPPLDLAKVAERPVFYRARYRGSDVRVVRLRERSAFGVVEGFATVTAWQSFAGREALARELGVRAALLLVGMMASIAALIWFGIRLGLSPLTELQAAVSQRSSDDLRPIRRPVPVEVKGLVSTLNGLFGQLSKAMQSKDEFIANAAHQLRNPIAAVLSTTQAAQSAKTFEDAQIRLGDVSVAALHASRLASQMLSYERIRSAEAVPLAVVDLERVVRSVLERNANRVFERGVDLAFDSQGTPVHVNGDAVLLSEALENLIDNALHHGGAALSRITVRLSAAAGLARLSVSDDGVGIPAPDRSRVFERFAQAQPGTGSGLGLSIVEAIAERHGGSVAAEADNPETVIILEIPCAE
jgi:two-component system sensor histidine kinase TctE